MPIYEFKCMDCGEYIELLLMNKETGIDLNCKKCTSKNLERIISVSNHTLSKDNTKITSNSPRETRTCSSGSCTTYTIPGLA